MPASLPLLMALAATNLAALGCGDGGNGPSSSGALGPIGPMPAGLSGKVALATSQRITTSSGTNLESRVHVVDMASLTETVVYTSPDAFIEGLTWSPDGGHIVMQSRSSNLDTLRLHRLAVTGTDDQIIFDGRGPESHPAYSGDGRLAYFARSSDDPAAGIHVDGSPIHQVSYDASSYLAWAPDGRSLIYTGGFPGGLLRLPLPEEAVTVLVTPEAGETITQPAVSPDGGHIAFMRFGGTRDHQEIWVATSSGAEAHRLTAGSGDGSPAWTPDGAYIAFSRLGGSAPGIYVIAPAGGTPQRIIGVPAPGAGVIAWSR